MKHLTAWLPELEEPPITPIKPEPAEPAEPADPGRAEPDREDPERPEPEKVGPERPEREEPERPERVEPMPSEPSGGRESATERPEEWSWWRRMFGGSSAPTPEGDKTPGREARGGGAAGGNSGKFPTRPRLVCTLTGGDESSMNPR